MKRTPLTRKTPLKRTRIKRNATKKSKTQAYYKKKVVERFMAGYRGQKCAVCGTTEYTCAHHLLAKGSHPAHIISPENIIVLCPSHHLFSNHLAPHSKNQLAVDRFNEYVRHCRPDQWEWAQEHEWDTIKRNWKEAWEELNNE